jgi:hypothetical protein
MIPCFSLSDYRSPPRSDLGRMTGPQTARQGPQRNKTNFHSNSYVTNTRQYEYLWTWIYEYWSICPYPLTVRRASKVRTRNKLCESFQNKSTVESENNIMAGCWLESICIRKVLRPSTRPTLSWVSSILDQYWICTQIPCCFGCFQCSPPNVIIKIPTYASLPVLNQNFTLMQPFHR